MNSEVYCHQLDDSLKQKMSELNNQRLFYQDNKRPHKSLLTCQKLGWAVLPHPPCSSDLTPSDYYLFLYFKWGGQKSPGNVIMLLPKRSQKVLDQNGPENVINSLLIQGHQRQEVSFHVLSDE